MTVFVLCRKAVLPEQAKQNFLDEILWFKYGSFLLVLNSHSVIQKRKDK